MYRTILCTVAAGAAIFAMPAKADETLKYRTIYYLTSVQSQNIPDTDGHIFGISRAAGVASLTGWKRGGG
jgi:hypothetical protein